MFYITGKTGLNDWWRYVLVFALMIFGYTIGQIPMTMLLKYAINNNQSIGTAELDRFYETYDWTIMDISSNLGFATMITVFLFATIGLWVGLLIIQEKPFQSIVTAFDKVDWRRYFFAWGLWFALGCLVELFYYLLMPDNYVFEVNWSSWLILFFIAFFYLPVQSSLEEFVFRGHLLQGFGLLGGKKIYPVLITAVLFALPHSFNPEIAKFGYFTMATYYIIAGIFLGIIVVMDDRLELALGVHAATNFFGSTILGYEGSVLQTDTLFTQLVVHPWLMTLTIIVAGIGFLLACSRWYGWDSFRKLLDDIEV